MPDWLRMRPPALWAASTPLLVAPPQWCTRTCFTVQCSMDGPPRLHRRGVVQTGAVAALFTAISTGGPSSSVLASTTPSVTEASPWLSMMEFSAGSVTTSSGAFPEVFVLYLSRFLIAYDSASSSWYRARVAEFPPGWGTARVERQLQQLLSSFAASVSFGLRPFASGGREGSQELWELLSNTYGSLPGAAAQLALLFSLLSAEQQPVEQIKAALVQKAASDGDGASALSLEGKLVKASDALAPPEMAPVWDELTSAYVAPASLLQVSQRGHCAHA